MQPNTRNQASIVLVKAFELYADLEMKTIKYAFNEHRSFEHLRLSGDFGRSALHYAAFQAVQSVCDVYMIVLYLCVCVCAHICVFECLFVCACVRALCVYVYVCATVCVCVCI